MFSEAVRSIVHGLPKGKVVTYGDISDQVYRNRGSARGVASAIKAEAARNPRTFPWWRVVLKGWRPTVTGQSDHLKEEGVTFLLDGSVAPKCRHELER